MIAWQSALWIWFSGLIFALSHSLLATNGCKQWLYSHGLRERYYRLFYSLIAVAMTAVWLLWIASLADQPLYLAQGVLWWLLVLIQLLGLLIVLAAFRPIDTLAFLGLRPGMGSVDSFIEIGIYRHIRHPMYSGFMLMLLAMPEQSWNHLHLTLFVCFYFIIGSRFEERRMLAMHPAYADYRRRVPSFIPRICLRSAPGRTRR